MFGFSLALHLPLFPVGPKKKNPPLFPSLYPIQKNNLFEKNLLTIKFKPADAQGALILLPLHCSSLQ